MTHPAAQRYELRGLLGRGAMASVYRAWDRERSGLVALKRLSVPIPDPDSIYRMKREFRSLAHLLHPNLVALYDLVATPDECFFTMELVEGTPFVDFVRSAPESVRFDRLREALRQLVEGLSAIHREGKLHRDVKPANVLVERGGRVVLLDFGLVSSLISKESVHSQTGALAGTLAYMAPEQAWGERLSPAADFYGVGVMVYEALAGRLPFEGPALRQMLESRDPPPGQLWNDLGPADLVEMTRALMSLEPASRPGAEALLTGLGTRLVGAATTRTEPTSPLASTPFVGRATELAVLARALEASREGIQTLCVEGVSGIGKTELIDRFLASSSVEGLGTVVLRARCHPHELVSFKAVDGLIDALARHLSHQPAARVEAVLPRNVAALVRVFPVLARVPVVAEACERGAVGAEPVEIRRAAFEALRELLGRLGDRQPLILWIDDLQWGDVDSAALLRHLSEPIDAPRILLLLSFRSEDRESSSVLAALFAGEDEQRLRRIDLEPLSREQARELVERLLSDEGASERDADALAIESRGSPFFACELARHQLGRRSSMAPDEASPVRVTDVVDARILELPRIALEALEVVAIAGRPLDEEVARHVVGDGAQLPAVLGVLLHRCLLRTLATDERRALAPYHDRIREAVLARISPQSRISLHRRLAEALERYSDADPTVLVQHYLEAQDATRAGHLVYVAAERAAAGLAFNRAASFYRRAIELETTDCPRWRLHASLGESLVSAGRAGEGAEELARAADLLEGGDPGHPEVARLRTRSAEQYLRSGSHEMGLRMLRRVLGSVGIRYPRTTARALVSLLLHRARLSLPRLQRPAGVAGAADADRVRAEICWSAGLGLSIFDPVRAGVFHLRHGLLARRLADPAHLARFFASQSLIAAMEGGGRKERRSAELALEAERFSRVADDPAIEAFRLCAVAIAAFAQARFRDALACCDEATTLCRERCVGAEWELANLETTAVMSLANLGEFASLWRRLSPLLRWADERSDLYLIFSLRLGYANLAWLADDRPEEARREAARALERPFPDTFTWQVYQGSYAHAQVELYEGHPEAASARIDDAWPALRASGMLRHQHLRIAIEDLRGRSAVAHACGIAGRSFAERAALRSALRSSHRLRSERTPLASAHSDLLDAGLEALRERPEAAARCLERAAAGYERLSMGAHVAAARCGLARLGRLRPAEAERARTWMLDHGIRDAGRMSALLAPGPWTRE